MINCNTLSHSFAGALLCVALFTQAYSKDIILIDSGQPKQTIEGFGTSIPAFQTKAVVDTIYQDAFRGNWVNDLGATVLRIDLWHDTLATPYTNIEEITWDKFSNHDITKTSVDYALAVHEKNPEIKIIASVWSPPAWMKENNSATGQTILPNKLREDREAHFARYLAQYCLWWKEHWEIPLYALSIQNEPLFDQSYGSCVYEKKQYARVLAMVCAELIAAGITDIKVFGPEHMTADTHNGRIMIDEALLYPDTRKLMWAAAGHGYTNGIQADQDPESAGRFYEDVVLPYELNYWMTETSGEVSGWEDHVDTESYPGALNGMAGKIHQSLTTANASLYCYWQITHPTWSNYTSDLFAMMNFNVPHKKYFAAKHYFKFIRPGAIRLETIPSSINSLDASAFLHKDDGKLIMVILNRDDEEREVDLQLVPAAPVSDFTVYRSSLEENFEQIDSVLAVDSTVSIVLPPRSMVTLYGDSAGITTPSLPELASVVYIPASGEAQPVSIGGDSIATWSIYRRTPWLNTDPEAKVSGSATLSVGAQRNRQYSSRSSWIKVGDKRIDVLQGGVSLFADDQLELGWRLSPLGFFWDTIAPFYFSASWGWCYGFDPESDSGFFMYRFATNDFIFYTNGANYYFVFSDELGWRIEAL